ncbi:hypothetical protein SLS64_014283 [Diaporthe eres]
MMRRKPVPETAAVTPHFSLVDQLRGFSVSSRPNVTSLFPNVNIVAALSDPTCVLLLKVAVSDDLCANLLVIL